jgi:hypothetical protein
MWGVQDSDKQIVPQHKPMSVMSRPGLNSQIEIFIVTQTGIGSGWDAPAQVDMPPLRANMHPLPWAFNPPKATITLLSILHCNTHGWRGEEERGS